MAEKEQIEHRCCLGEMLRKLLNKLKHKWKIVDKDCWDICVERCLPCIRAGYKCEIWFGKRPTTVSHTEACVVIDDETRIWLKNTGRHGILLDKKYKPPKFEPIFKYDFMDFVKYVYSGEGANRETIGETFYHG